MVQPIQTFDLPWGGICHCTEAEYKKLLDSDAQRRYNEASRAETTMIKEVIKYEVDGKEFDTKSEALQYSLDRKANHKKNLHRYLNESYSGRELLKKHGLTETGVWEVLGEDPNCDLGGFHHRPSLGFYRGSLQEVVEVAVDLHGFWQWGGGGTIKKSIPPNIIDLGE